jgi:uncharacterized metal-binding protein
MGHAEWGTGCTERKGCGVAKVRENRLDSVGWTFWLVVFVLLAGPFIWWAWQYRYESDSRGIPVILGLVASALVAGILSSAVNYVLQRRAMQRQKAERKQQKKRKNG